ncbi:MAG: phage tail sheath family protein, partial [Synergistaceae bacterium]|nr:phage tail sheath family protein [Synergistaceae bacterium]
MAYQHGVKVFEWPTKLVAPRAVDTALPIYVGTAPLHLSETGLSDTAKKVHYPILANTYEEAVTKLGYSDDWQKYSLCEAVYAHFALFAYSPIILVNVLDPEVHKTAVAQRSIPITAKQAILGKDVILDSVIVKATAEGDALVAGTDYSLGWDSDDNAVLNVLTGGALDSASEVFVSNDILDPSKVTPSDIIGGYNTAKKRYEGLEIIHQCFMKFGKVPSLISCPGWSHLPEVAAIMTAKTHDISGLFPSLAVTDLPCDNTLDDYTEVSEWKRLHSYTDKYQVACWPKGKLGDKVFHLSTLFCCLCAAVDAEYNDLPYASPSNHLSKMEAAVTDTGKELLLDLNQANMLNGAGVVTLFNWESGWQLWGVETACYPSNTDPKDRFINIRRFYNWYTVKFILTWFQKVDAPINRRLLETIVDTENIQLNAYVAVGALVGENNHIEFPAEENPTTSLIDGVLQAHTHLTVPPPARYITN